MQTVPMRNICQCVHVHSWERPTCVQWTCFLRCARWGMNLYGDTRAVCLQGDKMKTQTKSESKKICGSVLYMLGLAGINAFDIASSFGGLTCIGQCIEMPTKMAFWLNWNNTQINMPVAILICPILVFHYKRVTFLCFNYCHASCTLCPQMLTSK